MFNTTNTDYSRQLLEQVSMFANAVNRLTQKKQAHGELTAAEQGLLEANTHLLRQRVLQLHGLSDFQTFQHLPSTTTASTTTTTASSQQPSPHHLMPIKKRPAHRDFKQTAATTEQPPSTSGVPHRRRTKRMFDRACHHCATRFTSQWRTGPSGPSTLCNACGIRYARQVKLDRVRLQSTTSPTAGDESPVTAASPAQSSPPLRASVHFLLN